MQFIHRLRLIPVSDEDSGDDAHPSKTLPLQPTNYKELKLISKSLLRVVRATMMKYIAESGQHQNDPFLYAQAAIGYCKVKKRYHLAVV